MGEPTHRHYHSRLNRLVKRLICIFESLLLIKNDDQPIIFTLFNGTTKKAPPPAASITMAKNLGLTAQNDESHEFLVIRMLSKHSSFLCGCANTCRNLLCRTIRNDIWICLSWVVLRMIKRLNLSGNQLIVGKHASEQIKCKTQKGDAENFAVPTE